MVQSESRRSTAPLKKRVKRDPTAGDTMDLSLLEKTPKVSNRRTTQSGGGITVPLLPTSSNAAAKQAKSQANQKWESMFDCLLEFIEERREVETRGLSQSEKDDWIWDGNVPTTYKTKDGKALGRWVSNQRSAKSKETLREDREERLASAGLKWSVVMSGAWNEMFDELRHYVNEQAGQGKKWDGNVPTSYQIKSRPNSTFQGEDKNLGRWVNRQRSRYQAGKLHKDRQFQLEKLGLKWSVLASSPWDAMYETLLAYVEEKTKNGAAWDGNVPANYRTNDRPPKALGRWINRQRCAYAKNKLKQECIDKLTSLGLKWTVHSKKEDPMDDGSDSECSQNKAEI
jgi:hypothetical protein